MIWVIDTSALIRLFVPDGQLHSEVETAFNRAACGADITLAQKRWVGHRKSTWKMDSERPFKIR